MVIVLPNENSGLIELEASLDAKKLKAVEKNLFETEVELFLPKFKLEFGADLVQTFQKLGVKSIFGAEADLSGITGKVFTGAVGLKHGSISRGARGVSNVRWKLSHVFKWNLKNWTQNNSCVHS